MKFYVKDFLCKHEQIRNTFTSEILSEKLIFCERKFICVTTVPIGTIRFKVNQVTHNKGTISPERFIQIK